MENQEAKNEALIGGSGVKVARDALREAVKMRCTCSGFVIQYEGHCCCERGKQVSVAEGKLTLAIDAL